VDWAAWGPTLVAIVTAIFIAGQVTGRIKDQEIVLKRHDLRLDGHDDKLGEHSVALAESKAFQSGYTGGYAGGFAAGQHKPNQNQR
jgi:hypothetical protein